MNEQEKQLLLQDICGRLPYRVKINCFGIPRTIESISIDCDEFITIDCGGEHLYHPFSNILHKDCLPYLRSTSSMTEEEHNLLINLFDTIYNPKAEFYLIADFFNQRMLDYRNLIKQGLALEAPEGMYE